MLEEIEKKMKELKPIVDEYYQLVYLYDSEKKRIKEERLKFLIKKN